MQKPLRIAVNGLGRIGRMFIRIAWDNPAFDIVAANSPSSAATYAHLIKYDSLYGTWDKDVKYSDGSIVIDGKKIPTSNAKDKEHLPWADIQPDIVLDASGKYRKREDAVMHLQAGARRVVVTAPMEDADTTLIVGMNHESFDPEKHIVVSAASCTSHCSLVTLKVLHEKFGIKHGFITTVHAVTGDQNLNDGAHKDLRRARAATESIIPTSTGVTSTVDKLLPALGGKISALSLRVPITVPSTISLNVELETKVTAEQINQAFIEASQTYLKGHLSVSEAPLVSVDYKQNSHSAIIDLPLTQVVDDNLANIIAWYDNEWGYTYQVSLLLSEMAKKL